METGRLKAANLQQSTELDRHLLIPGLEHIEAEPNCEHLKSTLLREAAPGVVPFMELFHDDEVTSAILGRPAAGFADVMEMRLRLGYAHVPFRISPALNPAQNSTRWASDGGLIASRDDFDRFPWPEVDPNIALQLEEAADLLPEGMCITLRCSGVLENLMRLMGFEHVSEALYEDPDLLADVVDKIGQAIYRAHEACVGCEKVMGTFFGDDMGFKTSTMMSPKHIRNYILPHHKRIADLFRSSGKLFLLHSCGQVDAIMDDLIDFVGIDAKHSFEDAIEHVVSVKQRYGDRVGIIGGVDMDMLARSTPDEVAAYTRKVLEPCAPTGGYALGSGNSIANYIPTENYFAMLREGWRWNLDAA